jgi:hypothetical protein
VEAVIAIVLPEPYLGEIEIAGALARWKIGRVLSYDTLHNTSGDVWVGELYSIVRNLYKDLGFLK